MADSDFPDFEHPPVVETVLSVRFREVPTLVGARVGQFWERHLAGELPEADERPPFLAAPDRTPGEEAVVLQLELSQRPGQSRSWLHGGNDLVQIQSDWFAYNWRQTQDEPDYIRYEAARDRFTNWLRLLDSFVSEELGRRIVPSQCEVTYVNHIPLESSDVEVGPLGEVFRNVSPTTGQFLPCPTSSEWSAAYPMEVEGEHLGVLHLSAQSIGDAESGSAIRLVLTARARTRGEGIEGALEVCDIGREWIVKGFKDVTTEPMWLRWGLRED